MVRIDLTYEGGLRTAARHAPSGTTLQTDPPVDNHGLGESFSPTDLLATSLGACMLTIMGIRARQLGLALEGTQVSVDKFMVGPPRRVGRLVVAMVLPPGVPAEHRPALEEAARSCPVALSLHPDLEVALTLTYPD